MHTSWEHLSQLYRRAVSEEWSVHLIINLNIEFTIISILTIVQVWNGRHTMYTV